MTEEGLVMRARSLLGFIQECAPGGEIVLAKGPRPGGRVPEQPAETLREALVAAQVGAHGANIL